MSLDNAPVLLGDNYALYLTDRTCLFASTACLKTFRFNLTENNPNPRHVGRGFQTSRDVLPYCVGQINSAVSLASVVPTHVLASPPFSQLISARDSSRDIKSIF